MKFYTFRYDALEYSFFCWEDAPTKNAKKQNIFVLSAKIISLFRLNFFPAKM